METQSFSLEVRAIMTVTSTSIDPKRRISFLGRLKKEHFSNEVTRKAFRRLGKIVESRSEIMDWDDLIDDPNLSLEFREYLIEAEEKPARSTAGFDRIFTNLEKLRKRRCLIAIGSKIAKDLEGSEDEDDFDEDSYLRLTADALNQATGGASDTEKIYTFGGKKSNALALAKRTVNAPAEKLYKTGYNLYDTKNGGLPTSGVVLLAGSTSGGKSVLANNLGSNLACLNNIHVLKATLEMTAEQEMNRMLSMISGTPMWKIKQGKMNDREKKAVLKAAKAYDKQFKKGGHYSFTSPERGMTIEDMLWMMTPYGAQVGIIDYVGLLEGVDDDNQWRKLSAIVRQCKVHAQRTGMLFIILVQLDDTSGKIRYSGGMREHADVVWKWNYSDPEVRETHVLPVEVIKARDGELFDMPLSEQFHVMRILDLDEGGAASAAKNMKESKEHEAGDLKRGKGKFSKKKREPVVSKNKRSSMLDSSDLEDDDPELKPKRKKRYVIA